MELELKHLAPYLPYELKIYSKYKDDEFPVIFEMRVKNIDQIISHDSRKPILRPLSDLTKKEFGMHIGTKEYIIDKGEASDINYDIWSYLFENHFDVFGLIEKGLAIDKNKIASQRKISTSTVYRAIARGKELIKK